jgi:hypothetical protein
MCPSQLPTVNNNILYGTVARSTTYPGKADCGTCYELELSNKDAYGNPSYNQNISKAVVQITNQGGMSDNSLDFLVPGGGFGQFNGCSEVPGWDVYTSQGGPCGPSDNDACAVYGGFKDVKYCTSAFPGDVAAQEACKNVLYNSVFTNQSASVGYPGNPQILKRTQVTCPAYLTKSSTMNNTTARFP